MLSNSRFLLIMVNLPDESSVLMWGILYFLNRKIIITWYAPTFKHYFNILYSNECEHIFFQLAASLQNDQHLQKCPKCQHPAKVYPVADKGVCTNSDCNHKYCSKCKANYHGSASCVLIGVKRLPKEVLNTKKAKKFLKRLWDQKHGRQNI